MQKEPGGLYIGLLSGTSLDGVDAALFEFNKGSNPIKMLASSHTPYSDTDKTNLLRLCSPSDREIDLMGELDVKVGKHFAQSVELLLATSNKSARDISAIGSHGQTIRHRPNNEVAFTLQIGDPNQISYSTGITTIADFRRRDMAAGGQGAPLAPAFHQAVFYNENESRGILNIGGMTNLTVIADDPQKTIGYDLGPGNVLMDAWINHQRGIPYDNSGEWAASGKIDQALLAKLYDHNFFRKPYPKSTGREEFNLEWLLSFLEIETHAISPEDVQATLCELTALSASEEILQHTCEAVYICGGGINNKRLMQRLKERLQGHKIRSTQSLGIKPDWVEAALFAWLAKQTLANLPGNLPSVTGAEQECILGAIYPSASTPI